MATRNTQFAEQEFYHVYNRGIEKRIIYKNHADYDRFTDLLYLSNSAQPVNVRDIKKVHQTVFDYEKGDPLVAIGAYCLMPNHFHILLTPLVEDGVSTFMNKMTTSYSMYFNNKNERTGRLFEGNFKAQHADSDEYLKYLFSYIHLNPVKLIQADWKEVGIKDVEAAWKYLQTYSYSSLGTYLETTFARKAIIDPSVFPEYFALPTDHKHQLLDWLQQYDEHSF